MTREKIYFDPQVRPVDLARGSTLQNNLTYLFLCPAAIHGLAVVGMDGCRYAYIDLAVFRCLNMIPEAFSALNPDFVRGGGILSPFPPQSPFFFMQP